jgi:signal transduction histidine kinase
MKVSAEMIRDAVPAVAGPAGASTIPTLAGTARKETVKGKAKTAAAPATTAGPGANIRPLIDMIVSEIESLGAIVSKFLDFTKPLQVNPEEVEVEEFLSRASSLIPMGQFSDRSLRFSVSAGAERARFDRALMEQAVRNLLTNALAATEPGGEVLVGAERSRGLDGSRECFRIFVKDSGPGMNEEIRSQLFHPFFTTKSDGTGLGLSIVHRIVEEHGGSVEVSSEPGAGTVFTILLRED